MANARILVVEDEILVARELQSYLQRLEYEVVGIAVRASTVMQQVTETIPDLVLMDINLQGNQDGIELAGEIRDRFQIPVVYITAYSDDRTLERAKQTNPFGYVVKPFRSSDLRVAVELALFRRQAEGNESLRSALADPGESFSESFSESQLSGLPPSKLRTVLAYIPANLTQDLSQETLAHEIGMTPDYFARLFKRSVGVTVRQYVIQQRVEQAKQLLRQSDLSIAEIAIECGFANPSHLALHFKRMVGMSPKQFRRF